MNAATGVKQATRKKEGKIRPKSKGVKEKIRWKRYLPFYIMALPALIYILINNYIPMAGIVIAFKNYKVTKGIFGSDWCGLDNFKFLFSSPDALNITKNTILYNLAFIVIGTVFAIFVAILLSEVKRKVPRNIFQTLILLPYLVSIVVVAYLVYGFLSPSTGFINTHILEALGKEGISWYEEGKYWPFILVFVYIWKSFGYNSIIYVATIAGFDTTMYEAAAVDGATKWQQIRYVTLPCLKPTVITLTLMSVGRIFFSDFGLFYQVTMNSGSLIDATSTIDTYVFRGLMERGNIGMSAAAGFYQSLVGFVLILAANGTVRRLSKENALF